MTVFSSRSPPFGIDMFLQLSMCVFVLNYEIVSAFFCVCVCVVGFFG
jgi:hypothetical protein